MKKIRNVGAGPVSARKEKGITLVSLIITIILMLILVGVSVDVIIDGKLIDSAENTIGKADEQMQIQGEQEKNTVSEWENAPGEASKSDTKIYCVHEWGEWNVTTENTCMQEGVKAKTCIKCGAIESTSMPILGHSYASNEICTRCGYEAGVYAILYSDGDLCFNTTGMIDKTKTEAGKTVVMQSANIKTLAISAATSQPWYSNQTNITCVTFEEKVLPRNMKFWFSGCSNLRQINNIANLDTTYVTDMRSMFYNCSSLTTLDVTGFNTANVTIMESMFYGCKNLQTLDLKQWDVSRVTSMYQMFNGCTNLQSLELGEFNAINVTNTTQMFQQCKSLITLDISKFKTSNKLQYCQYMFYICSNVQMLDFSNFNTSNVSRMDYMFYSCQKLTSIKFGTNFTTANVTNMKGMFAICRSLTTLDISNFDTKGVKDMSTMFSDNPKLTKIDLRAATFDAVTTYTNMFYGANSNIKVIVKDAGGETNVPKTWIQNKLGGKGTVYTVTEWQAAGGE